MNMIYVSKVATKVRCKDGSFRAVRAGEYLPEAVNFQRPLVWAHLVSADSEIGKKALQMRKESDAKLKALGDEKPQGNDLETEQNNDANQSDELKDESKGTNEGSEKGSEENSEGSEDQKESEETKAPESKGTDVENRFDNMTKTEIILEAKNRFGTKINGRLGLDKVIKAYLKLEKDFEGVENKGESE